MVTVTWHTAKLKAALDAAEKKALVDTATKIVEQAKVNLKAQNAYAFGNLHRSIGFSKPFQYGKYKTLYIGFRGGNKDAFRYAMAIERGRRPGKMPPWEELIPWVKLKLRPKISTKGFTTRARKSLKAQYGDQEVDATLFKNALGGRVAGMRSSAQNRALRSLAFVVARAIGKRGTKPRPFLLPAFDQHKHLLRDMFIANLRIELRKRLPQTT